MIIPCGGLLSQGISRDDGGFMLKNIMALITLLAVLVSSVGCQSNDLSKGNDLTDNSLYANRSTVGRLFGDDALYYANVFDGLRLYRYEPETNTKSLMTDAVHRVQFISEYEGNLYFSALSTANVGSKSNIYRIDCNGDNLKLVLEGAQAPLINEGFLYYHDALDDYACGIYRMSLDTGEIQELIPKNYECSAMTINIVDNFLYAYGLVDIFALDLTTMEMENVTNGMYPYGIGKLQYSEGYLYYYTYGPNASIMRYDIKAKTHETVCVFNEGDFWYDVLLIDGTQIVFTGRQTQALREDQDESEMIRGTYIFDMDTKDIKQLSSTSLGPTCYIYNHKLIALHTVEDTGTNQVIVTDYSAMRK